MQNFNFEMHYLVRNLYINFSIYIVCITYFNILFTKKDCKYNFFFLGGGCTALYVKVKFTNTVPSTFIYRKTMKIFGTQK